MSKRLAKDAALVSLVGVAYYLLYVGLVGIAAAIAYPDWFKPFAQENKALSLILFSLVTTIPAAAIAALLAGFSITRLTSGHRVFWAMTIVVGATVYSAFQLSQDGNFFASLESMAFPSSVIAVPTLIAWWTFLPLSVALFLRRSSKAGK